MKHTMIAITRFTLPKGFYAEVIAESDEVAFWLGHKDVDIKEKMFALSPALAPNEKWESMLADNCEEYMEDFKEAWMED